MHSETDELLRACGAWKEHRRQPVLENQAHVLEEIIDSMKYLMSIAQAWGFTQQQLEDAYWWKSMAVRQRYSEEFVKELTGPTVIIDIDNVLADYTSGFAEFLRTVDEHQLADKLVRDRPARVQDCMLPSKWKTYKHAFRVDGWKRRLPLMPSAREFLLWCRARNYRIVLVTSRPIDTYPNLYADTVSWLQGLELQFDFIWWGTEKGRIVSDRMEDGTSLRSPLSHVVFAVDDTLGYCAQFRNQQIRTYWLTSTRQTERPWLTNVTTLQEIMHNEDTHEFPRFGTSAARDTSGGDSGESDPNRPGWDHGHA